MASTSFSNGTVIEPSWLNSVNASAYLARMRNVKMDPYNAVGDGVTDDYAAIQAVIDDGYIPFLPRGVFAHSQPFILKDNTGIIGSSCFWKRRTSYVYSGSNQSVLKYTGTTGTNTCSIRASALAVGTAGTDFTGPDTDDLINIVLDGIHIDGQGVDYPLYMYRCGNGGIVGNVTVEGGKKYNCVIMGIYDASWGHIGVYECQGSGIAIGKDVFSWGSVESTCFNLKLTVSTANNGTVHTYVAGTATDLDNCGIEAYCGRGCELWIDSEANYGRAGVLSQYNQANVTGGTTIYHPSYAEGNADGYAIIYRDAMDGIEISEGFIHPGNTASLSSQNFKVLGQNNSGVLTSNSGPVHANEWLLFRNLQGNIYGRGFKIDSNTYKFKVRDCDPGVGYTTRMPVPENTFFTATFKADATLSDTRFVTGMTRVDSFLGDGATTVFTLSASTSGGAFAEVYVNGTLKTNTTDYSIAGTTLTFVAAPASSAIIVVRYSNLILSRAAAGRYVLTFTEDMPDANYKVSVTPIQTTEDIVAYEASKVVGSFEVRTANRLGAPTLADSGAFLDVSVSRLPDYP